MDSVKRASTLLMVVALSCGNLFGQVAHTKKAALRNPAAAYSVVGRPLLSNHPGSTIKFEEIFADSNALSAWTILNDDSSTFFNQPSVGAFVDSLAFPGGSVGPQVPSTFFWASNFDNANGFLLDEWLISPQLPVIEAGDSLHFYGGAVGGRFDDSIQVWISLTDPAGSATAFDHLLGRLRMDGPIGNWSRYSFAIDSAAWIGSPFWLGLRYWMTDAGPQGSNSDNVWLDHILVTHNPSTGIAGSGSEVAERFSLKQNYPNPFNPLTIINYQLPIANWVALTVYDVLGRKVNTLVDARMAAGSHTVQWDGTDDAGRPVASGVYLYRLEAGQSMVQTRKMILLR